MKILKAIFGGIAKVIGYIMVTLGLWLPTLFTAAFFIVCAILNTELSKGIMAIFYCGLGFTAVGGLAIAMWRHKRLKAKAKNVKSKQARSARKASASESYAGSDERGSRERPYYDVADVSERTYGRATSYGRTDEPEQTYGRTVEREPVSYSRTDERERNSYGSTGERPSSYARTVERDDYSDLDRKYFGKSRPASSSERRDHDSYEGSSSIDADALWRRLSGADVPDEQPLMFRTRTDPDVYVYEYSDRYQYWRRTKAGMMLERTEFKKPEELRAGDKVRKS